MKQYSIFLLVMLGLGSSVFSQVAINQNSADSSAALDISGNAEPDFKGLLIPRMPTLNRIEIKNAAFGLLVFDTDKSMFYFYDDSSSTYDASHWRALNPWGVNGNNNEKGYDSSFVNLDDNNIEKVIVSRPLDVSDNVTINNTTDTVTIKPTGNITATKTVKANNFEGYGTIPLGGIIMWSGDTSKIPDGWALCDGNLDKFNLPQKINNIDIPNLSGRFIVGVGTELGTTTSYAMNENGGAGFVKLTNDQLPSHQHEAGSNGATINITSSGKHTHYVRDIHDGGGGSDVDKLEFEPDNADDDGDFTIPDEGSDHTHPQSSFNGNTGGGVGLSGNQHENRPPYYALAYIIRIK